MKSLVAIATVLLMCSATSAVNAKGCIKGAIVGGVAGHYAGHHGALGAAGCLYGRHHAKEQEKQRQQSQINGQGSCRGTKNFNPCASVRHARMVSSSRKRWG